MTYERFEDLPVWQAAMELAEGTYRVTRYRAMRSMPELVDQLRRPALSVSNNIAEGFERGTTAELLSFLYIARGSAGEVRSMLLFCERLMEGGTVSARGQRSRNAARAPVASRSTAGTLNEKQQGAAAGPQNSNLKSEISDLKSQVSDLKSLAESCSRQLRAWAGQLQDSDIEGPRRLDSRKRRSYESKKRADAFFEHLQQIRDDARQDGDAPRSGRDRP